MKMTRLRRLGLISLAAATLQLAACDRTPKDWKTPNMTVLTPRLQPVFEKTKSVCFGRFLVDVPESAMVVWGPSSVNLDIKVYPDGTSEMEKMEGEFVDRLKSTKAIRHNDAPLFLGEEALAQPSGRIVKGYEDYDSINSLMINGYFKLGKGAFVINSRPLRAGADETIVEIKSIARRLQQRTDLDIPTEPGSCIEHAFLPDEVGAASKEVPAEHIRIGFRLKEFPDTHLSIFVSPSNPHYSESDSLEWQLEKIEKRERAQDPNHPLLKTRYFRRGPREIAGWPNGWEGLSRSPDGAEAQGFHDFAMAVKGVPSDVLQPFFDIRMQTGVGENAAGAVKPSLTDEEAIAVWDKITSSIRVRPTGAPAKVSATGPTPRLPLGELAATGRACPQTGWWQSAEAEAVEGGRRKYFSAGESMPHVVLLSEPSLWQKLRGTQASHRAATVWKLVEYDEAFAASERAPEPPMQKG